VRVMVTGGAGRLGVNVCNNLLEEGYQVRVFDLNHRRHQKSIRELDERAEVHWGDITEPDSVRRALEGVDAVVHMAGKLPPVVYQHPELARRVNVGGTKILVDLLKEKGGSIPLVFTSSVASFGPTPDATEPLSVERDVPKPGEVYGETKLEAENLIRESGVDYIILRLSAVMYFTFALSDVKRMYSIPLNNRIEFCHQDDLVLAILNAVKRFDSLKGNTLVVSGGPREQMLYRDMIGSILKVMGLPLPPARKFIQEPCYLDWYDTGRSQELLEYQKKKFSDYLEDYERELTRRFSPLFLPFMRYFASPLLGRAIVRLM